jgi:tRNA threonylcarbamoyladenosine biosynthesis protein TsaB
MKLLALDTATEQMAVAVGKGESAWTHGSAGGALASATLVPTVLACWPRGVGLADLDAIAFGQGRAPSPGCAPRCRWPRGWPSGPASRCCRWTAC